MVVRHENAPSTVLPSLGVLVAGGIWGLFWYPLRLVGAEGVSADWVNLMFFAVSATFILPWALRGGTRAAAGRDQWITGLLLGTAFAFYTLSLVMTEVVRAILLFYLTPVWSALIGVAFLGERLTARRALALALGFGGLWLILGGESGLPVPRNAGDWIGLVAGLCWSLGTLGSYHRPSSSIAAGVLAFSLGGLAVTAAAMMVRHQFGGLSTDLAAVVRAAPLVLTLGLCMFTIPNIVVLWAAQRVEPARIGILLLAEVLTGTVSAALFSDEPFGAAQGLGAMLIAAAGAVEVSARRQGREGAAAAAHP
ncbi:MAG TPA: DMT family transporter [Mesorhizobium sp.]|jgi:drug/metabolite transporter (DMT)-like permease|nr:DMT family transporter [Mesorhizobium sp.]